ncbi:MAG TPA: hypothetical protein VGD80_22900 [Kofleriaceae bacterium]
MRRAALVFAVVAIASWPERARACRGDGTAASCLREERQCMDGWFGWFRSCDFSCGDCPVRPPEWTPGPPNTAPMSEFLPAVGDTIAAIPGAVVGGIRQIGNDVMACVTDPFGSLACVRVGVVVGGTVCAVVSAGTCAPLVMSAGLLMSIHNCVSSCSGQPGNYEACKEACAGTAAAGATALVAAGTGAFQPRPPLSPGGQFPIPNPLNLMPPPALAGGPTAVLAYPPIAIPVPFVPALQPAIAGAPMLMVRPPDGMGDPNDYRGPGPYRDEFTNPETQGELEAEHVPSKSLTQQQTPGVEPEPLGMGPKYSNGRKGALTKDMLKEWREYERWVREMDLTEAEKQRLIEGFWAIAREEDWYIHNGGGAMPVDPDLLDQLPAPRR